MSITVCIRFFLFVYFCFFFFKQKTAYEMRISDWSSDVCSSDLLKLATAGVLGQVGTRAVYSGNRIDLQAVFQHALRGGLGIGLYGQGLPGFFESPGDRKSVV